MLSLVNIWQKVVKVGSVAVALAAPVGAAVTTSHLASDAAAHALVASQSGSYRFATEAKAGRFGSSDWELAVRQLPAGSDQQATAQFDHWGNDAPVFFTVVYSPSLRRVLMTLSRGTSSALVVSRSSHDIVGDATDLFLRTVSTRGNTCVSVSNLFLNGLPVPDRSEAWHGGGQGCRPAAGDQDGDPGDHDVLRIAGGNLAGGFILAGTITFRWQGGRAPRDQEMDVQIWGAAIGGTPPDSTPPAVGFTAPASGALLNAETVAEPLTATWSDAESGIDTAMAQLVVDGVDRTAEALISATGLSWPPTLTDGSHTAELRVRDLAGNLGSANLAFASDATPPTATFLTPTAGSLANERQPTITVEYADAGSGLSFDFFYFSVDGNQWSGRVTPGPSGFSYTIPAENAFSYGGHFATVEVFDLAGNRTYKVVEWDTDPDPAVVKPFDPAPGTQVLTRPPLEISGGWRDYGATITPPENVQTILDGQPIPCEVTFGNFRCRIADPTAGPHLFRLEVTDPAGNFVAGETSFEVVVDRAPPLIELDSPPEDFLTQETGVEFSGRVTDDTGIVSFEIRGVPVAVAPDGRFSYRLEEPDALDSQIFGSAVSVTAIDGTLRRTVLQRRFEIDRYPPDLEILEPAADRRPVNAESLFLRGRVNDASGIDRVEVGTVTATLTGQIFEAQVPLAPGENALVVRAFDRAENVTERTLRFTRVDLPPLAVTWPAEGERFAVDSIEVRGTTAEGATVRVDDRPALVTGTGWVLPDFPLAPGGSAIRVEATTPGSGVATAVVHVVRDLEPPHLAVTTPRDGATVSSAEVWVSGLVNDVVPGTVHAGNTVVSVAGQAAAVGNRSFAALVPLALGVNTVAVMAVDAAGNRGETSVTVTRAVPTGRQLEILSGNRQVAGIGSPVAAPLRVRAVDEAGAPAAGRRVVFRAQGNDGHFDEDRRAIVATTGAEGIAEARFTLGTRAGVAAQRVSASAVGFGDPLTFLFDAEPGPPILLVVDAGDHQTGVTGRLLPRPLAVAVVDDGANRLPDVPITFRVTSGGGTFADGSTETARLTDPDGRAAVQLVLGPDELTAGNTVDVFLAGTDPDAPGAVVIGFTASGKAAGALADTTISGLVLDNQNEPVPGVTIRLAGTALETTAGADGRFVLTAVPPGERKLLLDGTTTTRPGTWPPLEFNLAVIPGRDNTVGMPIFLLPLDLEQGVWVDETTGGTLNLTEVPGFALEIAPGSVTFPDGSRAGLVSVTPVHSDKVPMTPNFGQQPRLIFTIQPAGAHFNPPARMTLPNVEGLAPGQVTEMYSFDHDLGSFVSIGPATVSDDGQSFSSNPGVGIVKAGWHCGGDPGAAGTLFDCPPCTTCNGRRCVSDFSPVLGAAAGALEALPLALCSCPSKRCETNEHLGPFGCEGDPLFIEGVIPQAGGSSKPVALLGDRLTFDAVILDTNCRSLVYQWDLGDGTIATGRNPVYEYRRKGKYMVKLKVTCGGDCVEKEAEFEVAVVEIKLKEVTFSGSGFSGVLQDGGAPYVAPHWQDNSEPLDGDGTDANGDRSFPLTYVRSGGGVESRIEASAKFVVDPPADFGDDPPKVKVTNQSFNLSEKNLKGSGSAVELPETELEGDLPATVDFLNPLALTWEVKTKAGDTWRRAGKSENRVYVTLGMPETPLFESVLDIGCRAAQGSSDSLDALFRIWTTEFTPPDGVKRKDADGYNRRDEPGVMYYWVDADDPRARLVGTFCQPYQGMLDPGQAGGALAEFKDIGTCTAWADLFVATLLAQGIYDTNRVEVSPLPFLATGMLVKNWAFPLTETPEACREYRYFLSDMQNVAGVPGQGRQNPVADFNRHYIARVGNSYFDPSYGTGPFVGSQEEAEQQWEDSSIEGYIAPCLGRNVVRRNRLELVEIDFRE